ncbi:hypothetical protein [Winogradskyella sp.]|uniref:hypothetical protein n=1 Tax=Winogradskyella sp. TaxID=1883156 RepID=UPI0025FC0365|nr:hypothetical protein [Winogradskyella sp.]
MKYIIFTIALLYSVLLSGQEKENLYVLEADSTWLKEIIKFPLGFAQDIAYEGYEDLRFAKNWSKPEGLEFFTYAFVWNINLLEVPTVSLIETNTKLYYDGLMAAVNKEKDFTIPKTIVEFHQLESEAELPSFRGKMLVHDSFFTKKIINLNVSVETTYCKEQDKYLMLFRVSTLDFDDVIWNQLNAITLASNICEK